MPIVTVEELKEQLRIDHDDDDAILERKIAAAQNHIERMLGFKIEEEYPMDEGSPPASTAPAAIVECVSQLAAYWYENRESAAPDAPQLLPLSVYDVVGEYRNYSWADAD